MQIDPGRKGKLPTVEPPAAFANPDGRFRGWRVTLPGGHTLATPAVADGRVFLGGGFGSYEFYALDAATGAVAWQYQTGDDGPTAAVVTDGHVVFNTESCELEVLTVAGRPVWKKWLGDPLMSMPAAADGRIYMAFPDSRGDRRHYLACFGLEDGREYWRQPIAGEVITAPVLADGHVYFTTLDGTLHCARRDDGRLVFREPRRATSSPVVWGGECYFSQRQEVPGGDPATGGAYQTEHLAARKTGEASYRQYQATSRKADYLDHLKRRRGSPRYAASARHDAAVGFAHLKGDAKMHMATANLGHAHVHAVWAYQGSKPFVAHGRLYAAHGDTVSCANTRSDAVYWKRSLAPGGREDPDLLDSPLTPPATVNGKLFFGTTGGEVHCLSSESGELLWSMPVGEPILFQPAVVGGRVYAGTDAGGLVCLETGDPQDDGWRMWGADAAHNGRPE